MEINMQLRLHGHFGLESTVSKMKYSPSPGIHKYKVGSQAAQV